MKNTTSAIARLAFAGIALLSLGAASAIAGPEPIYAMIHGEMMVVTPMMKDVTCKDGCTVHKDGSMTMGKSKKKIMLKEGEMVTTEGKVMKPAALSAHGG